MGGSFFIVQIPLEFKPWQTHPAGVAHDPPQLGCVIQSVQFAPDHPV